VQDNPHRHQAGEYSALRHGRIHPEAGFRCDTVAENGTQTSRIFRYEWKKIGFTNGIVKLVAKKILGVVKITKY
jgi:hypothetical protein